MHIADLSIRRPVLISCMVILMLALGYLSLKKLPVNLFPDVTFPVVVVSTVYPGAGPEEIETLITQIYEEELSTLPGIKKINSTSQEGISAVVIEFNLDKDIQYAEQQVRERVSAVQRKLPTDVQAPVIRRVDPSDQPIMTLALSAKGLSPRDLYSLADRDIKPAIEQVKQVGLVSIIGGKKREIQVHLDAQKLRIHELSASRVVQSIAASGTNTPAGNIDIYNQETVIRTVAQYSSLDQIGKTAVTFLGNDVPVAVSDVGRIVDTYQDEKNRAYVNGEPSLFLHVYRQSGSNAIAVVNDIQKRVKQLNKTFASQPGSPEILVVKDTAISIRANVADVKESILIGILLTIVVVYLFLGSAKSTFITALALPNSLLGAFVLMSLAGFSINIMTLLALSLSVGLLVDDAIVVRENIFRHMGMGKSAIAAAIEGTKEVSLAVIATTLTILAVFGPIAFLQGMVGQFFKEFGMTICFAMIISLFDALTIAPMLSAYFAGKPDHGPKKKGVSYYLTGWLVAAFDRLQTGMENGYVWILRRTIKRPLIIIFLALVIFAGSIFAVKHVSKTFLPPQDNGEFVVSLEMPPGTSLNKMGTLAKSVDKQLREMGGISRTVLSVGTADGAANVAEIFVVLVPSKERKGQTTSTVKDQVRERLKPYAHANPVVKDGDATGGGQRPFNLNIKGQDLAQLEKVSREVLAYLKTHPALKDADVSLKAGKPEFQIVVDAQKAGNFGVSPVSLGQELRTLVEGSTPGVYRENGEEYDIRVRLKQDQRDLSRRFENTMVPNLNQTMVRLSDVAIPTQSVGPTSITRQNRSRYTLIAADLAANGPGVGDVMQDVNAYFVKNPLPQGMSYSFSGQAESFQELGVNMMIAAVLGILFIYLVLASLYESFVTPLTIMLVLPLAACGAFYALWITDKSLDIFSMIGCIMLLGVSTKNSILLVDYIQQLVKEGHPEIEAIIEAGRVRLRPIMMTSLALIAGMLPIAIGLNEASKQRTSMGVAIIGGLITSTLLTLVVIPATYRYIEKFRRGSLRAVRWVLRLAPG